jgi:hypothetical protein
MAAGGIRTRNVDGKRLGGRPAACGGDSGGLVSGFTASGLLAVNVATLGQVLKWAA